MHEPALRAYIGVISSLRIVQALTNNVNSVSQDHFTANDDK